MFNWRPITTEATENTEVPSFVELKNTKVTFFTDPWDDLYIYLLN